MKLGLKSVFWIRWFCWWTDEEEEEDELKLENRSVYCLLFESIDELGTVVVVVVASGGVDGFKSLFSSLLAVARLVELVFGSNLILEEEEDDDEDDEGEWIADEVDDLGEDELVGDVEAACPLDKPIWCCWLNEVAIISRGLDSFGFSFYDCFIIILFYYFKIDTFFLFRRKKQLKFLFI